MNKDFEQNKDLGYDTTHLRGRITQAIKGLRDQAEELDIPQSKTMPVIPVTGSGETHKYLHNKSPKAY